MYQIYNEDCIEGMNRIPDETIDAIICDPPYQSIDAAWDIRLPIDKMWEQFNRVTKKNGAIVLFSQLPFAVDLINANRKMFRYEWIWEKSTAVGYLNANKMPLRAHENILVFYRKLPIYNPQWREGKAYSRSHKDEAGGNVYKQRRSALTVNDGKHYYPRDVLKFNSIQAASKTEPRYHPTQKPLALMEFLVKTYTNEGETVLDATMGSGSTGEACILCNRKFIGFETEKKFFAVSQNRLNAAIAQKAQSLF